MAQQKDTTNLSGRYSSICTEINKLGMLEWLCHQMMEAEVSTKISADNYQQRQDSTVHDCGNLDGYIGRYLIKMGLC